MYTVQILSKLERTLWDIQPVCFQPNLTCSQSYSGAFSSRFVEVAMTWKIFLTLLKTGLKSHFLATAWNLPIFLLSLQNRVRLHISSWSCTIEIGDKTYRSCFPETTVLKRWTTTMIEQQRLKTHFKRT